MAFTCPRCDMTSHHPKDAEHGYCGACHDFTGYPTAELQLWYDLRRAADELALAKWRAAHPGYDVVIPDHADLVIFLIDQLVAPRAMTVTGLTDAELDDLYERSKLDSEIIVGSEIRQLVSEIWSHRRLNRVDTTLAKRLGEMIEANSAIKTKLADWQRAYPLDIFPEPDLVKAAELLKAGGMTLDAVSANMARHVLKGVTDIIQSVNECPSCKRMFIDGETCSRGGCPMGGDV